MGLVAQTYQYHPLVDSNATKEWNYWWYFGYHAGGGGTVYEYPDVLMTGDTLINGLTYKKVFEPGGINHPYESAVMEDGFRKVFLKQFSDTSSSPGTLIFDFSLQVNDTFISPYVERIDTMLVVRSIDTIFLGGALRRQFVLYPLNYSSYDSTDVWVEGIGSLRYGLYQDGWASLNVATLCRAKENDTVIYAANNSCYFLGVDQISPDKLGLHLYPNPTAGLCTLEFSDVNLTLSASIFDITGREVMQLFNDKTISTYTFNTNVMSPGIYLIKANSADGKRAMVKLVKE